MHHHTAANSSYVETYLVINRILILSGLLSALIGACAPVFFVAPNEGTWRKILRPKERDKTSVTASTPFGLDGSFLKRTDMQKVKQVLETPSKDLSLAVKRF